MGGQKKNKKIREQNKAVSEIIKIIYSAISSKTLFIVVGDWSHWFWNADQVRRLNEVPFITSGPSDMCAFGLKVRSDGSDLTIDAPAAFPRPFSPPNTFSVSAQEDTSTPNDLAESTCICRTGLLRLRSRHVLRCRSLARR